jgi:hypothetical protein
MFTDAIAFFDQRSFKETRGVRRLRHETGAHERGTLYEEAGVNTK